MRFLLFTGLFAWLAPALVCFGNDSDAPIVVAGDVAFAPCKLEGLDEEALCGTYEVWEDREKAAGRKISLNIVLARANVENPKPEPVFFFSGGPGTGAAELAAYTIQDFSRSGPRDRDLVFVDQRGTGASNKLDCDPSGDPEKVQTFLAPMFTAEYVNNCRQKLEQNADLTLYTSIIAAADINEIRAAMGYEKINIFGASYGGRMVLEFLRRHPEHVRAALPIVAAPQFMRMPASFAADAQKALDAVTADCEADEACRTAFPNFAKNLKTVLARVKKEPVTLDVVNPLNQQKETVTLTYGPFAAGLRSLLYGPSGAAVIPKMIEEASVGNFEPMALYTARYQNGLSKYLAHGMYLSVSCAEDLPFVDYPAAVKASAGTFLGDYRVTAQWEACKLWPRGVVPDDHLEPIKTDLPVLFVAGAHDPVTPPDWSRRAARGMPNSKVVVIANSSHNFSNAEACFSEIARKFLETASVENLDDACAAQARRPDWIIKQEDFEKFYK